jgi:hypothetical protein
MTAAVLWPDIAVGEDIVSKFFALLSCLRTKARA